MDPDPNAGKASPSPSPSSAASPAIAEGFMNPSDARDGESRAKGQHDPARSKDKSSTRPSHAHLPSPVLTPNDPPDPVPEPRAQEPPSSSTKGVPTPEMSGESSEGERSKHDGNTQAAEGKTRPRSNTKSSQTDGVRRLSASKMQELTAPEALPVAPVSNETNPGEHSRRENERGSRSRPVSTPPTNRRRSSVQPPAQPSSRRNSFQPGHRPPPMDLKATENAQANPKPEAPPPEKRPSDPSPPSPIPPTIPLPPMSIPTHLQLELAGQRPSPLYIHHSHTVDIPYESYAVKFERLKNFLLLPWFLERAMGFGVLACLDAWLWTFTVLPIRFCIALGVLGSWWLHAIMAEGKFIVRFVWGGLGRMWKRGRVKKAVEGEGEQVEESTGSSTGIGAGNETKKRIPQTPTQTQGVFRHRRTRSKPSNLTTFHKADLLQGAIILCSSIALMNLDASRMYHFIRAQSAIKLYAIYNLLEVSDRLLSALGQDVLECLLSTETLSRNPHSGRSRVMLPLGMFILALVYNILHSVILFYQVIALNVAVNSYSNALLTLLLSNQFVEIKSTVFKRFEKENTFQLACADIVERFQLWVMLTIIGMRNVVEVGGLSVPGAGSEDGPSSFPLHTSSILPASFTILPSWIWSGEVLSPFFVVIGSEMVVDWIKHAYVNKFNNIKPSFYGRILDILCKDYYTNAFVTPSLTRRLGLPLLPLSCLFIRASIQTYNMFLATHLPTPLPPSTQTSLSVESATPSPAMIAALDRLDNIIRNALGRAVYGAPPYLDPSSPESFASETSLLSRIFTLRLTSDDAIAALTFLTVFLLLFLILLLCKLLLGMLLLRYSRNIYARMKLAEHNISLGKQERESYDAHGKRTGGYGTVEVGDERRRWLFADDGEGLRKVREKERRAEEKREKERERGVDLAGIRRYEMVARRIW